MLAALAPTVVVAAIAAGGSVLTALIGLSNRQSLRGKNGIASEIRANTTKIEEFRRWTEKHDMEHLIDRHDQHQETARRLERLEQEEE